MLEKISLKLLKSRNRYTVKFALFADIVQKYFLHLCTGNTCGSAISF